MTMPTTFGEELGAFSAAGEGKDGSRQRGGRERRLRLNGGRFPRRRLEAGRRGVVDRAGHEGKREAERE